MFFFPFVNGRVCRHRGSKHYEISGDIEVVFPILSCLFFSIDGDIGSIFHGCLTISTVQEK
jgi:hypothetical protein